MDSIEKICKQYSIRDYTIKKDGSIDVYGSVDLSYRGLEKLPLKFNEVSGYFRCSYNNLTTLEGSPRISGKFICTKNELTSLEHSPKVVHGDFYCVSNYLKTLKDGPERVMGSYHCNYNEIVDLYGISNEISSYLYCEKTPVGSIINKPVNLDFIQRFNIYKVIKDDKVVLKRLKYIMDLFNMEYDLEKIEEHYEIN